MSGVPPVDNVFAFHDPDPDVIERVSAGLRADARMAEVWHPAPGWVVGAAPLPGGEHVDRAARGGVVFACGADAVFSDPRWDAPSLAEVLSSSPQRSGRLRGDPTVLHLREAGGATVVRSAGGAMPVYVFRRGERTAISTLLGDLVRHVPDDLEPDPLVQAIWTTGVASFPDRRSPIAGVEVVRRGWALRIEGGRTSLAPHWFPRREEPEPESSLPEQAAELRGHLLWSLGESLDPDHPNLLSLSGGVDSSALAFLIGGTLGRPLSSLTFVPDDEDGRRRVVSVVSDLVDRFAIAPAWTRPLSLADRLQMLAGAHGCAVPPVHPVLQALPEVVGDHRVLVGGEFADEVCGSRLTWDDWVRHTSLAELVRLPSSRLPHSTRDRLRWARARARQRLGRPSAPLAGELSPLFRDDLREEYREWRARTAADLAADGLARPHLAARLEADGWAAMNWELCSELGIRRAVPFLDRSVLELAFRCHPRALVGPGTKRLLRTALAQDVPASYLDRDGKAGGAPPVGLPAPWPLPSLGCLAPLVRPDAAPTGAGEALVLEKLALAARGITAVQDQRYHRPSHTNARTT